MYTLIQYLFNLGIYIYNLIYHLYYIYNIFFVMYSIIFSRTIKTLAFTLFNTISMCGLKINGVGVFELHFRAGGTFALTQLYLGALDNDYTRESSFFFFSKKKEKKHFHEHLL